MGSFPFEGHKKPPKYLKIISEVFYKSTLCYSKIINRIITTISAPAEI